MFGNLVLFTIAVLLDLQYNQYAIYFKIAGVVQLVIASFLAISYKNNKQFNYYWLLLPIIIPYMYLKNK